MTSEEYSEINEIGGGAYGKLYKARQPKLERDVALKIVDASIDGAPDALAHAKAMAKVEHENIVKIFAFENFDLLGEGESHDVIVMQWLPGKTLENCLAGERFSERDAIAICTGVIDGLIALHGGNVAHGDLHCRNIMIVDGNRPVIIDVHPVEQAFLSQQSLTTRDAKVSQDIGFCRTVIVRTLRHSLVSAVTTANFDTNLVRAATLEEIKKVVEGFADGSATRNQAPASTSSLFDDVLGYIENDKKISLQKLVVAKTKAACGELISGQFTCQMSQMDDELIRKRIAEYEEILEPVLEVLAPGAYWGNQDHQKLWTQAVESLANVYETQDMSMRGGKVVLLELRRYPPLVALYVAGFAAWLNENFDTLFQLLRNTTYVEMERSERLPHRLFLWKASQRDLWNKYVLEDSNRHVPISEHLLEVVTPFVEPLTALNKVALEDAFNDFEYFCGLVEAYGTGESLEYPDTTWGLVGRFIWKFGTRRSGESKGDEFAERFSSPTWAALQSGFFGGKQEHFFQTIRNFEEFCGKVRSQKGIF